MSDKHSIFLAGNWARTFVSLCTFIMLFLQNTILDDNLLFASHMKRSCSLIDDMNVGIDFDMQLLK